MKRFTFLRLVSFAIGILILTANPVIAGTISSQDQSEFILSQKAEPLSKKKAKKSSGVSFKKPAIKFSGPIKRFWVVENVLLELTNRERTKRALKAVIFDPDLAKVAAGHSRDMLLRNFFGHTNPDGFAFNDRVAFGHRTLIGLSGENVWMAKGDISTDPHALAELIMDGWMNSPPHRKNILTPKFTHVGFGAVQHQKVIKVTQVFAQTIALLSTQIPDKISPGAKLDLSARPFSARGKHPIKYDLWSYKKNKIIAGPFDIKKTTINVAVGNYRLRFYFIAKKSARRISYKIYPGPELVVRKAKPNKAKDK